MLIKVVFAVLSARLVTSVATGEADSAPGVALVQVDAKRINAVQMQTQPYDGQELLDIEEQSHAPSHHSLRRHSHSSRHSHRLPSARDKSARHLSRSRCRRYEERAAAPSRGSSHHLLVSVEEPHKSRSQSGCVKCGKQKGKCREQNRIPNNRRRRLEKERRNQKLAEIKKHKEKSLDKQKAKLTQTREQQNQTKLFEEVQHLKNKVKKLQRRLRKKQKSFGKEDKPVKKVIVRETEEPASKKKVEPVILPLMERLVSLTEQQQTPAAVESSCCPHDPQPVSTDSSPACESCEHAAPTDCCGTARPSTNCCSSDAQNSSMKNLNSKNSSTDSPSSESSSRATLPLQSSSDTPSENSSTDSSSSKDTSTDSSNSTSASGSPETCIVADSYFTTNSTTE